jgi:hypothetical protein
MAQSKPRPNKWKDALPVRSQSRAFTFSARRSVAAASASVMAASVSSSRAARRVCASFTQPTHTVATAGIQTHPTSFDHSRVPTVTRLRTKHALKYLACRKRVAAASSPAATCKQGAALTSPARHACGCTRPLSARFGHRSSKFLSHGSKT